MQAARLTNEESQMLATRVRDPSGKQTTHGLVRDQIVRTLELLARHPGFREHGGDVSAQALEDFRSRQQRADRERRVTGFAKRASGTHSIDDPWRKDCGKPQQSMSENVPRVSENV